MPGILTKYHRAFMPRFAEVTGRLKPGARKARAGQIRTLRNQVGRVKAKSLIVDAAKKHIASHNEKVRTKKLSEFRAANPPTKFKSPRWRKRGGGKVTVKKLARVPKQLQKS